MKVAALAESVTVSGEVPLVETARSEPTSVVLADQIKTLPVFDRNFLVLIASSARPARQIQWGLRYSF